MSEARRNGMCLIVGAANQKAHWGTGNMGIPHGNTLWEY